jgi:error-prone DNA polymerase
MIGCRGQVQREGDVIHLVAEYLIDLSDLLRSVASRDDNVHQPQGGSGKEPTIKVTTRDFR